MKNRKRGLVKKRGIGVRRAGMLNPIERLENRCLLSAAISVSNPLMAFNAVEKSSVSPTETLTITDVGTAALTLGSGAFSLAADPTVSTNDTARFSLLNLSSAPASLSPGQSFTLNIDYNAISIGINSAILNLVTNASNSPTEAVHLRGIGTKGLGGSNQPSLATILQAYDIPTLVGEGPNDDNASTDSIYPNPPDASSQEVPLQRLVKAGTGPVTIDVLASFTASGFPKSYTLGTYTPGNPASLHELFYTSASENQTTYVQPIGATTFDPGANEFGFYFVSNVQTAGRIGYSEDSLNTWDTTNDRKIRFFPMETPTGTVVPNSYIMTSTEWNAPIGYDFTNIVAIVSNVKAAPGAPTGPVMGLQNLNPLPGTNRMIFNTILNQNTSTGDIFHSTSVLAVNNTGDEPLIVSSYSLSSGWALVNPPTFPFTVQAGKTEDLTIKFVQSSVPSHSYNETNDIYEPQYGAAMTGAITLNGNDPDHSTESVPLAGYFQNQSEDSEEPSLQTMVNLVAGWDTSINSTPIPDLTESSATSGASPTYYGQEVVSGYWEEADTSEPVSIQQLAAFHTQGNTATTYWYQQGHSGSVNKLFNTVNDDGQSFFPDASGTTTPAAAMFSTSDIFGFKDDTVFSDDSLNSGTPGGGHHVRFYPIVDSSGNIVPNTYIMCMDYTATPENFDFQDNVWIVSNVRPVSTVSGITSPQTTGAQATPIDLEVAGETGGVSLQWAAVLGQTVSGYNIYRSTSATGTFTLLGTTTTTSYFDTTAPGGTTEYYKVTAVSSSVNSLPATGSAAAMGTSTTPPPAPTNFTATGIVGAVSLSWSAVSDSTLAGYDVYSSSSAAGPFTLLTSSPITATTYVDSAAPVGSVEYYQVTAVDSVSKLQSSAATASGTALASTTGLQSIDIGASPSGSTTVITPNSSYNVTAGGPGIAGTVDGFRFIYQSQTGNFDVSVQVASLTVAGNYSTAGILARSTLSTTSPDVYMSASPVNYRFKYRTAIGGVNEIVTGGSIAFPNVWVRLTRVGNLFTGYTSTNGTSWTSFSSITVALPNTIDLGLAAASNITTMTTTAQLRGYGTTKIATPPAAPTSLTATGATDAVKLSWTASTDSTLKGYNVYSSSSATGTFKLLTSAPITGTTYTDTTAAIGAATYYKVTAVDASSGLESTGVTASATALAAPLSLTSVDIGASPSGSTTTVTPGSAYTVTAGGPGVTGNSDGFRFLYTQATGNFDMKVQVASITVAGNFSTAGIMARSTLDADSANVYMSASPVNYRFKDRPTADAATAIVSSGTPAYPNVWVRLQRVGNVFNGYTSTNGTTWTLMSSVTIALPTTIDLGLAVASNVSTTTTTAVLQDYSDT